jgi:hypothetical protein
MSNDSKITQFGEGISKIFNPFIISKCSMMCGSTLNASYSQKKLIKVDLDELMNCEEITFSSL